MDTHDDGRHDFDFLHGKWRIHNARLAKRLAGNDEWLEFEADHECWPLLGGMANVESFVCSRFADGKPFQGMGVRVFNPMTRLWTIYWADDRVGILDPGVVGRWEGKQATFLGDDTFAGKPIRVRFLWNRPSDDQATWEQAFSPDGEKTWETNWRMVLKRR